MDDDINAILGRFVLTSEEDSSIDLGVQDIATSQEECSRSLIGKIISDKPANFNGVKNTMGLVWGKPNSPRVIEIGKNLFQFVFEKQRVVVGEPWLYDRFLISLRSWCPGEERQPDMFNPCALWMQIWNLPLHWLTPTVGRKIGESIGGILDVAVPDSGGREGCYVRICCVLNITHPLPRGKRVTMGEESRWVTFKYENLPYMCFYCGILGNNELTCAKKTYDVLNNIVKEEQFGAWLRAETHVPVHHQELRHQRNEQTTISNSRSTARICASHEQGFRFNANKGNVDPTNMCEADVRYRSWLVRNQEYEGCSSKSVKGNSLQSIFMSPQKQYSPGEKFKLLTGDGVLAQG